MSLIRVLHLSGPRFQAFPAMTSRSFAKDAEKLGFNTASKDPNRPTTDEPKPEPPDENAADFGARVGNEGTPEPAMAGDKRTTTEHIGARIEHAEHMASPGKASNAATGTSKKQQRDTIGPNNAGEDEESHVPDYSR